MGFLFTVYQEILFRPIFNALYFLYNTIAFGDFGIAIVLLTVFIRILLIPLFHKSLVAQKKMGFLQPEIKRIQEEHKNNKEEQSKRLMNLYKEKGVNPFSGCAPLLIQLPILIALYNVFLKVFDPAQLHLLYFFVHQPDAIIQTAFGFLDLSQKSLFMALLAGASQYVQALTMPQPPQAEKDTPGAPDMAKILSFQTKYFFPILIFFFSWSVTAALPLYWTVLNIFAIVQQKFIK